VQEARILIVEDERNMREVLSILLEGEGYTVRAAGNGSEGIKIIERDIFDLVITDIKMPGASGFEVLKRAQEVSPDTMVIMITAFGTIESGIEAMKLGAYDYIHKPFKIDEIRLIVKNAMDKRRLKAEVAVLRETVRSTFEIDNIIGKSEPMQKVLRMVPKVAANNSNVLVTGESGTGKELIAAALHNLSPRRERHYVPINCASLPENLLESELFGHMKGSFTGAVHNKQGLFEIADEGTLFLDEIAEMPMNLQSKFLRAIEYGTFRRVGGTSDIKVNTRIIAATNRDLKQAVAEGIFREDLFFRLNVIPIHIPPLRERRDDIPLLLEHFISKYSTDKPRQFTASALGTLMAFSWPGNIRELENMVERILLFADSEIITNQDLPEELTARHVEYEGELIGSAGIDLESILAEVEKKYLIEALRMASGNKTDSSKLLGLSFRSFRHKLSKYGIKGLSPDGTVETS
jgi:two-component system response regulator PilR (NtrC family)